MENSKRGWVLVIVKKYFSDSQCPTTCKEMRKMGKVLYASTIGSIIVKDYIDASFQTDRNDTKSQSSYMFIKKWQSGSWRSSKYDIVAISATQAKYIDVLEVAKTPY
ncbi:hypothetical protein Tco_1324516 [Tanacetum coccineum]